MTTTRRPVISGPRSAASAPDPGHGPHEELEDHDLGLRHDLPRFLGRRRILGLVGGWGAAAVVAGCASDEAVSSSSATASSEGPGGAPPPGGQPGTAAVAAGEIPEETAGPFPGDGSNGPNVLTESGVVRQDITRSFGEASGVADGVPTTLRFRVYDLEGEDVTVLAGAAVYAWHCDRDGLYSLYSEPITGENYLRGVQVADEEGWLSFSTILPGCYDGRWPHVHFEVYRTLADATAGTNRLRTSQLAIPEATCREVYGVADGYDSSLANLDRLSLDSDMVFADGYSLQLAKVAGDAASGYTLTLNVPV